MSKRLQLLAALIYYAGIAYLVIKPLWLDNLRHEHVRATYYTNSGYLPIPMDIGDQGHRSMLLNAPRGLDLNNLETIDLFIGTYVQTLQVSDLVIKSNRGDCRFRSQVATVRDNDYLHFQKGQCDIASIAAGENLEFSFTMADASKNMVVWATNTPNKFDSADAQVITLKTPTGAVYPVGALGFKFTPTFAHRAAMIERVWGPALPAYTLQLLVAGLLLVPALFWLGGVVPWTVSLVTFFVAMILMALFTLVAPPLQAPDEATHFWNYVHINGRDHLKDEILTDINRSHYERVFCHDLEKLDSADLSENLKGAWPEHGFLLDLEYRTLAGFKIWKAYDTLIGGGTPLRVLLEARALNALLIASLLAAGSLLLSAAFGGSFGLTPLLTATMMPTFWFFASHLSNHTFIIAGYIGLMILTLALLRSDRPAKALVIASMSVVLLSMTAGRASMLSVAVALALLAIGAIFSRDGFKFYLANLIFWPLAAGAMIFFLRGTPYFANTNDQIFRFFGNIGLKFVQIPVAIGTVLVVAKLCVAKSKMSAIWEKISSRLLIISVIVFFAFLLALPSLHPVHLPNIEFTAAPAQWRYVKLAVYTLFTNLGIGGDDFLVIRTLWGGFGCPDNFFSQTLIDLFKVSALAGLFLLVIGQLYKKKFADFVKTCMILAGALAYFVLLAAACWQTGSTLHGRYILGFVMIVLAVAVYGYSQLLVSKQKDQADSSAWMLLLSGVFVQVALLTLEQVLLRYYA